MKLRIPLLFFLLLIGAQSASATSYTFIVPSSQPWTDTGISVPSNSLLQVTATGTVVYDSAPGRSCGPAGGDFSGTQFFASAVVPGAVIHALVGKLGGTSDIGSGTLLPEGVPGNGLGFIGTNYTKITTNGGGDLFLGFNCQAGLFPNNSGFFTATITVTPPPFVNPLIVNPTNLGTATFTQALGLGTNGPVIDFFNPWWEIRLKNWPQGAGIQLSANVSDDMLFVSSANNDSFSVHANGDLEVVGPSLLTTALTISDHFTSDDSAISSDANGNLTATSFIGDGSGLTGTLSTSVLPAAAITNDWKRTAGITNQGFLICSNSYRFPTNTAPTSVTVGTTPPDRWMTNSDLQGNRFYFPVWTNH